MHTILRKGYLLMRASLAESRPLTLALLWQLILLLAGAVAMPFDHRIILGLNPWVKPMKFELSVIIFLLTVTLLLYGLRWHRSAKDTHTAPRVHGLLGWGFALSMTVENTVIALQSLRGVRSHMNYSSALDGSLFAVMGLFILLNTVLVAVLLFLWFASRVHTPPAVTWGIRLGLFMLLVGSMEGAFMVAHGGHTVGAPDGLPGVPLLNWSRSHGDLRVAHLFALHALQVLPLAGWLLSRTQMSRVMQIAAVWLIAAGYFGAVWWLFASALRGRPLVG